MIIENGFLKNEVGKKEWNKMLEFLEAHENYLLSDLIYNRYIFELYEKMEKPRLKCGSYSFSKLFIFN